MFKRLLVVSSIVLTLIMGFILVPSQVAHADSCSGNCGPDPVAAGCTNSQYIAAATNFWYNGSEWQIRLRESTSCPSYAWASLVLISGRNGIYNAAYLKVNSISYSEGVDNTDTLYSSTFYNGAYTNVVILTNETTCAYYSGAYTSPPRTQSACA